MAFVLRLMFHFIEFYKTRSDLINVEIFRLYIVPRKNST